VNIVLIEPEIPPNTGNIARLCAATHTQLHLIEPLGFELSDRRLKRAGMDYWNHVDWKVWPNWITFDQQRDEGRLWFIESSGAKNYTEVTFGSEDSLVFGRETAGLPERLLAEHEEQVLHIPMFNEQARSLNLANCVGIVLFEALRQQGFQSAIPIDPHT
jgi:tRNA (cytidine/uridine-2'-O-)-methyltransferase